MTNRVLVVGVPRSGTTWVANVLARSSGASYAGEPDNHLRFAHAFRSKYLGRFGEYPCFAPGDDAGGGSELSQLWDEAFTANPHGRLDDLRRRTGDRLVARAGGRQVLDALHGARRRSPLLVAATMLAVPERAAVPAKQVLVKSVYAALSVEWVAARTGAQVVVVLRHPLNVVSSWLDLGWVDPTGPDPVETAFTPATAAGLAERFGSPVPGRSRLARTAWLIGVLTCALSDACDRNPSWARVVHEDLCVRPPDRFPVIAASVGLGWSTVGDDLLAETDRPGSGYEITRVAKDLPEVWRRRLGDDVLAEVQPVLQTLPLSDWA